MSQEIDFGDQSAFPSSPTDTPQHMHTAHVQLIDLNTTEEAQKPLSPLEQRLQSFTPPTGFMRSFVPRDSRGRSVIYDYSVKGLASIDRIFSAQWHCLADSSCRREIKLARNTSNISDHLARVHKITGKRSQRMKERRNEKRQRLSREKLRFINSNPQRYHELGFAKIVVWNMLPFCFGECQVFRMFLLMLANKNEFKNDMHIRNFLNCILPQHMLLDRSCVLQRNCHHYLFFT